MLGSWRVRVDEFHARERAECMLKRTFGRMFHAELSTSLAIWRDRMRDESNALMVEQLRNELEQKSSELHMTQLQLIEKGSEFSELDAQHRNSLGSKEAEITILLQRVQTQKESHERESNKFLETIRILKSELEAKEIDKVMMQRQMNEDKASAVQDIEKQHQGVLLAKEAEYAALVRQIHTQKETDDQEYIDAAMREGKRETQQKGMEQSRLQRQLAEKEAIIIDLETQHQALIDAKEAEITILIRRIQDQKEGHDKECEEYSKQLRSLRSEFQHKDAEVDLLQHQFNESQAQVVEKQAQLNEKQIQLNDKQIQINEKQALLVEREASAGRISRRPREMDESAEIVALKNALQHAEATLQQKDGELQQKDGELRLKEGELELKLGELMQRNKESLKKDADNESLTQEVALLKGAAAALVSVEGAHLKAALPTPRKAALPTDSPLESTSAMGAAAMLAVGAASDSHSHQSNVLPTVVLGGSAPQTEDADVASDRRMLAAVMWDFEWYITRERVDKGRLEGELASVYAELEQQSAEFELLVGALRQLEGQLEEQKNSTKTMLGLKSGVFGVVDALLLLTSGDEALKSKSAWKMASSQVFMELDSLCKLLGRARQKADGRSARSSSQLRDIAELIAQERSHLRPRRHTAPEMEVLASMPSMQSSKLSRNPLRDAQQSGPESNSSYEEPPTPDPDSESDLSEISDIELVLNGTRQNSSFDRHDASRSEIDYADPSSDELTMNDVLEDSSSDGEVDYDVDLDYDTDRSDD
eukprot:TRINITY_DN5785_c0_g1_i1.p1 TRINITY_DN5785_c0_g1~~TRINITY_DN5785_c0_g1_i1.p1  ORF type:complete len:766 (+),score=239.44 TRINITY_DN5785_c0_g1_i1:312-2609(+)